MKEARLHQEISKYSDQGVRKHWLIVPCEKRFSLANACKPGPTLVGRPCCRPRRVEPHLWGEGILCIKSRSKISIQLNWEFQNLSLKKTVGLRRGGTKPVTNGFRCSVPNNYSSASTWCLVCFKGWASPEFMRPAMTDMGTGDTNRGIIRVKW